MDIFKLIRLFKTQKGRSPTPGELDQLKVISQQQEMNKNVIQFPRKNKAKIDAEPNMLQRELMEVSDDVSPGYASGDTKYNAQILADGLAEKRYNVEIDDLDQYEQMALYDEAYKYLTQLRKNFKQPEFPPKAVMDNLDAEGLANIMRKKGIDMEVGTASKTTKKKPTVDPELQAMDDQNEMFKDFSTRNLTGIEAMKEASSLIGRKGKYKNISPEDAKKKLDELQEIINKADAEPDLGTKLKNFDGDPDAMAQGGRAGYGIGNLVKEKIPPEYRLYAKSILPGGESGKVDESYFTEDFKKTLRTQALEKFKQTGKLKGSVNQFDQVRGFHNRDEKLNKLVGMPSTYASLGAYSYEIDPKTLDVKIKDRYDWNPSYGKIDKNRIGFINNEAKEGRDVDLTMMKDFVKNSIKEGRLDKANALELIGNYFGGKESQGTGFDVDINIPTQEATTATEGSFAQGGIIGLKEGGPPNPGRRNFMKLMAGVASLPFVGKFFKGAKVAKTVVPLTNTSTVMPAWFPSLIDKAMDRGIKNKIDADLMEIEVPELPGVKIQRHDDGRVFVEGQNEYGRPYAIEYEPPGYTMVDEATGKSVKTKGDFRAIDSVPEASGPEDVPDFFGRELDEVDDILGSDVRVMEEFATGSKIKNPKRGENIVGQAEVRAENAADEAAEQAAMEADEGFAKGGLAYLIGGE